MKFFISSNIFFNEIYFSLQPMEKKFHINDLINIYIESEMATKIIICLKHVYFFSFCVFCNFIF